MDFTAEWKSRCRIGSVFYPPLLLQDGEAEPPSLLLKRSRAQYEEEKEDDDGEGGRREKAHQDLGPLVFIPNCDTLVELYSSPDLSPRLPPPYAGLSLRQFLHTSGSGLLPSTASSIASELGPQSANLDIYDENIGAMVDFNCLQLLPCGESNSVLAFFPTGENYDQVGYAIIHFEDSQPRVKINEVNNKVFMAKERLNHRIVKLSVNQFVNVDDNLSGTATPYSSVIGYLMVCSMHSVNWYLVKTIREPEKFQVKSALLDFVGSKSFRNSAVVHCCWSPHLSEESIVLLDTGELYLFDLIFNARKPRYSNNRIGGKKLQVSWDICNDRNDRGGTCWLGCEFSWHPRILVVAHTTAVFLVDAQSEGCNVSCLLNIQMLSTIENDGFIALSRAGSDGFNFCVASKTLLLLCDVRQPWRPLLQWVHNLDNPRYLTVFPLSDLRSSAHDMTYKWASESGSCILLGSFWKSVFGLFVYGPNTGKRSVSSEISKFCNSLFAWGLPAELSLSGRGCNCGSCSLRDELLKDSLPKWIDWRQKKDIVLGFSVLPLYCVIQLPKPDNSSGFFLLRLMSSGKLEGQYYSAAWKLNRISSEAHFKSPSDSDSNLFYDIHVDDYELKEKFEHLKLDYLEGYLKGNLAEILVEKLQQFHRTVPENEDQNESSKKLETDGSNELIFSRSFDAFKDINFPISIQEIALRRLWSQLQLALSKQFEFPRLDEFLSVSQHMVQFPFQIPSICNNKLLHKIQPCNDLLGSLLPPQFLFTLYKLIHEEVGTNVNVLSADTEIKLQCDRMLKVTEKLHHGHGISLSDATDELSEDGESLQNFSLYEPGLLLEEVSAVDTTPINSVTNNKRFTNFVFKKQQEHVRNVDTEITGLELLDTGCPIELKFNNNSLPPLGKEEIKLFKLLKKQDLNFQKGFILYQEFITKSNLVNQCI